MPMSPRLLRPRAASGDSDVLRYVAAVEAADGQALEQSVKDAIRDFILGCKTDNTWSAIKASCILMGARTLSGALVPLVGTAPTNNGPFVSGDYNRRTGLVGNGTTKYLSTGRANNADPQNSQSMGVWVSVYGAGSNDALIGSGDGTAGGSSHVLAQKSPTVASERFLIRSRALATTGGEFAIIEAAHAAGLCGLSRSAADSVSYRFASASGSASLTSATPDSSVVNVFARGVSSLLPATHRLAYYWAGESLSLSSLNSRVTTLYNAIHAAVWNATADADARAYVAAVEAADGQPLEPAVRDAIETFIVGCKADGIWSAIKASCLLMGARTLSGALTPLVGAAPTNNNFVSGDYNRKTGLLGNGTSKYLNSNRASNADPQDNVHISVYVSAAASNTTRTMIGDTAASVSGQTIINGVNDGTLYTQARLIVGTGAANISGQGNTTGFKGVRRASSTEILRRSGGVSETVSAMVNSSAPTSETYAVFARTPSSPALYSADRLAFYSIGESLALSSLDSRLSTLYNAIGVAIP